MVSSVTSCVRSRGMRWSALVATCLLVYIIRTVSSDEEPSCGCGGSTDPDFDQGTPSRISEQPKPKKTVRTTYEATRKTGDYYSYYRSMYRYWRPDSRIVLTKSRTGPDVTFCKNFELNENGTAIGVFVCPLPFEPAVFTHCCGDVNHQFCCKFDSSGNMVRILAGCLAGLVLVGALGGFLFWLWYSKKRFNRLAPQETAYVMHVPLPAAPPSKPLQSSFSDPAHAERRASVRVHFHPQIDNYPFQMDSSFQDHNGQPSSGQEITVVSQIGEKPPFSVSDPPPAYEERPNKNTTTMHM
ncbi:hypothetical protein LSAT2_008542 [Lamellibrachia satsuma]|nr:hypothetical protein LSAT2_008542 [Lamellibrachia satsuma]